MISEYSIHTAYYPKIDLRSQCYNFSHVIKSQLMDVFSQSLCFQLLA